MQGKSVLTRTKIYRDRDKVQKLKITLSLGQKPEGSIIIPSISTFDWM